MSHNDKKADYLFRFRYFQFNKLTYDKYQMTSIKLL